MIIPNLKIIAFAGACFSGKTSTMNEVKRLLGDNCLLIDELIRGHDIESIDDVRMNPVKYLELQDKIIREKMRQELHAQSLLDDESMYNKVLLFDRSIYDSLFYLTFYVDKSRFTQNEWKFYTQLLRDVIEHCKYAAAFIYNNVIAFEPINFPEVVDKYRPDFLDTQQEIEYDLIMQNVRHFFDNRKIIHIETNSFKDAAAIAEHLVYAKEFHKNKKW